MIRDRRTEELAAAAEHLDECSRFALLDRRWNASAAYTEAVLWADKPAAHQGDLTPEAWQLRIQRAEAARRLWLAVELELEHRDRPTRAIPRPRAAG